MDAIVYTSNTGFTAKYAQLLSRASGLPAYPLGDAGALQKGADIIYMGWLMAGSVKGYKKAAARYRVRCVCGVGMAASGSQLEDIRKRNNITDIPVFSLQGGFDAKKLRGAYKLMMTIMAKSVGKGLSEKKDRTPEEDDMLDLMLNGGDRVDSAALVPVLDMLGKPEPPK